MSDFTASSEKFDVEDLGRGFLLVSPKGYPHDVVVLKRSKGHLSVWEGGWRELCRPTAPWATVERLLVALGKFENL